MAVFFHDRSVRKYIVTAIADTGGTITGGGKYKRNKSATVSASTNSGYRCTGLYEGSTLLTSGTSYTFKVTRAITITSKYIRRYTVSVSAQTGGSASGGGTFDTGSSVTVTASATSSYNFSGWYNSSGTLLSSSTSYTFTVSGDISLQARFTIKTYSVSVSAQTGGSASGGGTYNYGNTATVSASASSGYKFTGWYNSSGTLVSSSTSYSFTVTSAVTLQARFTIPNTTFSASSPSYPNGNNKTYYGPYTHTVNFVGGVKPKSVQFTYHSDNFGGDHGYLYRTSTNTASSTQSFTETCKDINNQGPARSITTTITFYSTYFTLVSNMQYSCSEGYSGTMIYE